MSKFTPGPYEKVEHSWNRTSIYDTKGNRLCLLDIEDFGDIDETNQQEYEEAVSAQADLFLSAPDLLDVAEKCLEREYNPFEPDNQRKLYHDIKAAIAKATKGDE